MSNAGAGDRSRKTTSSWERGVNVGLWLFQVVLALVFAMAGLSKLFGDEAMVAMFADIGIGQWFRYVVGGLEVAGALGVLVPRLCGLAALGLAGVMVGAVFANLVVLDASPWLPLANLLVAVLVAWGRWPRSGVLLGGRSRS